MRERERERLREKARDRESEIGEVNEESPKLRVEFRAYQITVEIENVIRSRTILL